MFSRINTDIAIVGAGPVGATLALALARHGNSVSLIDAREQIPWDPQCHDLRVYAVSRASQNILTAVGAWGDIAQRRVSPYRDMQIWDAGSTGRVHFSADQIGEADLGHIVEANLLTESLLNHVRSERGIQFYVPAQLQGMEVRDDYAELTLDNGERIRSLLVVGADGSGSKVRHFAHIPLSEASYRQDAIVAQLRPEIPHGNTARQGFLRNGPLALLPLSDGTVSIVWSVSQGEAKHLHAIKETEFSSAVTKASDSVLGFLKLESRRLSFPLVRLHAQSYVAPRVVLVGDAAHVVHPLAGQGMNLGLLDAAALVEVVTKARASSKLEPDDYLVLRRYERWRHSENLAMQSAFSTINSLFCSSMGPVKMARGVGMHLFDATTPAKRLAMCIALGLAGDLPELATLCAA